MNSFEGVSPQLFSAKSEIVGISIPKCFIPSDTHGADEKGTNHVTSRLYPTACGNKCAGHTYNPPTTCCHAWGSRGRHITMLDLFLALNLQRHIIPC